MIILICGLTASGKSITAKAIAKKLNYKMIHTSDVLKQIINKEKELDLKNTEMNKGDFEKSSIDSKRKIDVSNDKKLDKFLLDLIDREDNLVFDSWTLPYLSKKGLKIWLGADLSERAKRAALRGDISFNQSIHLIKKKDNFSKSHFKKLYGFDFGDDLKPFDFVLDTTNLSLKEVENEVFRFIKSKL